LVAVQCTTSARTSPSTITRAKFPLTPAFNPCPGPAGAAGAEEAGGAPEKFERTIIDPLQPASASTRQLAMSNAREALDAGTIIASN
jgi:hypothetical protein